MSKLALSKDRSILKPGHERWDEFIERLDDDERALIYCKGGRSKRLARKVLKTMEGIDVEGTLKFFESEGGYCDCEIVLNVQ